MTKNRTDGGGLRFNNGKIDLTQCPETIIYAIAATFMKNSDKHGGKYPNFNWRRGMDHSKPMACLMRHMMSYQAGEDLDPESGLPHLWHAACNLAMLIEFQYSCPQLDDRFKTDVLTKLLKDANVNSKETTKE